MNTCNVLWRRQFQRGDTPLQLLCKNPSVNVEIVTLLLDATAPEDTGILLSQKGQVYYHMLMCMAANPKPIAGIISEALVIHGITNMATFFVLLYFPCYPSLLVSFLTVLR
jgi:hypothetical protein